MGKAPLGPGKSGIPPNYPKGGQVFTKCMTCRKWAECPYCGTCHACRPDVAQACATYRSVKGAESLLSTQVARKHQASTFTQDAGMGANGCEPRVTARHHNWYGSPEYRQWAQEAREAQRYAERHIVPTTAGMAPVVARKSGKGGETA